MASLLQRLAYGESLSAESRGGGRQSNARLLPFLFQLGQYFAGFCSTSDLQVCTPLSLIFAVQSRSLCVAQDIDSRTACLFCLYAVRVVNSESVMLPT